MSYNIYHTSNSSCYAHKQFEKCILRSIHWHVTREQFLRVKMRYCIPTFTGAFLHIFPPVFSPLLFYVCFPQWFEVFYSKCKLFLRWNFPKPHPFTQRVSSSHDLSGSVKWNDTLQMSVSHRGFVARSKATIIQYFWCSCCFQLFC